MNLSGDSALTVAANMGITGNLDNTSGGTAGAITFAATTTDTTLVSGTVGASTEFTSVSVAPAAGKTATFGGTYDVATTTHSGAGTVAFSGAVAGDVDISNNGIVTAADTVTGDVDNTSGTAGRGTLTLADGVDVTGDIGGTKALGTLNLTSTAGTALDGIVSATNINLSGTGTTTVTTGDVTGTVNFKAANTLLMNTANQKIVGSVTTAADGAGTLTFGQTVTTDGTELVSGNIGSSTAALLAVNAKVATLTEASFGGDVYADTITLTGATSSSEFTFDGDVTAATGLVITTNGAVNIADGKNLTADVTTTVGGAGILNFAGDSLMTGTVGVIGTKLAAVNVNGGEVTFSDDVSATTTTVAAAGTFKTSGDIAVNGAIANSGTLDLGGTLTSGGAIDLGSATTSVLKMSASSYTGDVVIDSSGQTINATEIVDVTPHAAFTSGSLTLLDTNAGAGTAADVAKFNVIGNALATYALTEDVNNDIILTATAKTAAATATELSVSTDAATALHAGLAATAGDDVLSTAYNTAIQAGGVEAQKAAEESQQNVVAPTAQVLASVAQGAMGAISDRLSSARTGVQMAGLTSTSSGVAAGGAGYRNGGWAKLFGGLYDQGDIDGAAGYDSSTFGVAVGADKKMTDTLRMGVAGSYALSNVDGKDLGNSDTDINAYQFAVYGSYEPKDGYFIDAQIAYAYNQIDTERMVDFGGLNRKASGEYDADQFSMNVGVGMPLKHGDLTFVPRAGLFYSYTDGDEYTETGAGGMNLTVDPGDHSILEGSLGSSVSFERQVQGGVLRPEARAALMYEFLDDDAASTSTFSGAATSFSTKGLKPSQFGGAVGVGLGYSTNDGVWDVRMDYDAQMREEAVGHSGMLTGRMYF